MARNISMKYILEGKLHTASALHSGGLGSDFTDLTVAYNGKGEPYIPGTSLAGPLRAWIRDAQGEVIEKYWWGDHLGKKGYASRIIVEDALLVLPNKGMLEVRDGVGIDRHSGTAADQVKFNRTVVPRGTTFTLRITVDVPKEKIAAGTDGTRKAEEVETMFKALATALQHGWLRVGACKSRGMGKLALCDEKVGFIMNVFDFQQKEGMLQLLGINDPPEAITLSPADSIADAVDITIVWQPKGPLMVKAAADGLATDTLPLTGITAANQLALLLPGSSVKGALRFQAERIMRTLLAPHLTLEENCVFLEQVKIPVVDLLFGASHVEKKKCAEEDPVYELYKPLRAGIGCLFAADCYAKHQLNQDWWSQVFDATDTKALNPALASDRQVTDGNPTEFQQAYHIAIDRWTAEPKVGALFEVLEPHGVEWEPLCFSLNLSRIKDNPDAVVAVKALLLLVLRDFARGVIPLGFAVNRGMGDIKVESITLNGALEGSINNTEITLSNVDNKSLSEKWGAELTRLRKLLDQILAKKQEAAETTKQSTGVAQ